MLDMSREGDGDLSGNMAQAGYDRGVPMGGSLQAAPQGKAPRFLVAAMKDPLSGNLDRIQIIKGWYDETGNGRQKVYDVAWSDNRQPDEHGKLPPVGNTVDIEAANWTNTIGASELATVWTDPDFDSGHRAFYYARVLENPTCRWTTLLANSGGTELPDDLPATVQERGWSSPIWSASR